MKLEAKGAAVHLRSAQLDQLELTPVGAAMLARCKRRVAALEAELPSGLSAEEEHAVRRWLARVATEA